MALLSDVDRFDCWARFQRDGRVGALAPLLKTELRDAANAVDQWVSDNQVSFNSTLPLPARTALTAAQKALLLLYVVEKRFLSGV